MSEFVFKLVEFYFNVVGIKEIVDVVFYIREMILIVKVVYFDFVVFLGYDDYFLNMLFFGGDGFIFGIVNFVSEFFVNIY